MLSRVAPRVPAWILIAGGNVLLSVAFLCLTLGGDAGTWACAILFAVGNGLMWPSYLSVLSELGGASVQGAVQGHAQSMGSAASIAGLVLGGMLYDVMGTATFYVPSAVILVAGLASGRICHGRAPAARSA